MAKETVHTPTDYSPSTSTKPSGRCIDNGEPGLPERSAHPSGVDEVTYDENSSLAKGEQK